MFVDEPQLCYRANPNKTPRFVTGEIHAEVMERRSSKNNTLYRTVNSFFLCYPIENEVIRVQYFGTFHLRHKIPRDILPSAAGACGWPGGSWPGGGCCGPWAMVPLEDVEKRMVPLNLI